MTASAEVAEHAISSSHAEAKAPLSLLSLVEGTDARGGENSLSEEFAQITEDAIVYRNDLMDAFGKVSSKASHPSGALASNEILNAAQSASGGQKHILSQMHSHLEDIGSIHVDGLDKTAPGLNDLLSEDDVNFVASTYADQRLNNLLAEKAKEYALNSFESLDMNGDQVLTGKELLEQTRGKSKDEQLMLHYLASREWSIASVAFSPLEILPGAARKLYHHFNGIQRADLEGMTAAGISEMELRKRFVTQDNLDAIANKKKPLGLRADLLSGAVHGEGIRQFIAATAPEASRNFALQTAIGVGYQSS